MKLHRAQLAGGYLIAAILVLFPLMEVALAAWPLRPESVTWRYGTTGIFSRALMTPLLGLLLASGLALLANQSRTLRALAVTSAVVAFFLLFSSGRFLLDALHMRAQVGDDAIARSTLDATAFPALFKLLFGFAATVLLAVGGWFATEQAVVRDRAAAGSRPRSGQQGSEAGEPARGSARMPKS
jgi:hypothetical protein